ncbi:MAG: TonB-dependent receptor [Bacteroidales bacterium]|nr:TonB-dependent receptor [Bacteroidales bacterium]
MKPKNYTLFFLVLAMMAVLPARAQKNTDSSITGHVTDAATGEHLPFVTVMLKGTMIGTQTTVSGHYTLRNIPLGRHTVVASAIGYSAAEQEVEIRRGETIEVNLAISEDLLSIEQVVVSATRNHSARKESPTLVNVVDIRTFATTSSPTLADGLVFQPGVRVENDCQNCGFTQARINGLCGHYSQILIDSRPVFSALAGVYGLEQIPAAMIDRVEVVRGGGSALFGASAIGGTINIITKEALRSSAEISHDLTFIGMSRALDNNTNLTASMVSDDGRAGLFIFGQKRTRDGYDASGDGFTEIPTINSITIGTRGHLRLNPYTKLGIEYHGLKEFRRGGDRLDRPAHEALIAEQVDHMINSGSVSLDGQSPDNKHHYSVYASAQLIDRNSYYGGGMDPNAYGKTRDITSVAGAQYTLNLHKLIFMPAQITAGVEYSFDKLHDVSLGYDHTIDQTVHIASAYLQNEWKNTNWSILAGVRVDKHNLIETPIFSPRVNIRYSPVRDLGFRAIYAQGFRAPQAFDEDLHISVVGGERTRIRMAKGLREERSHSVSVSADWYHTFGRVKTNFMVEGFYTLLKDTFALRETGERTDGGMSNVLERYNGSGATVFGCNLEGKAEIGTRFNIQAGITFQRSRYEVPEVWSTDPTVAPSLKMFRSPDSYGYLVASYHPVKTLGIHLSGIYTGSMLTQHFAGSGTPVDIAVDTPRFWDMGCKLTYEFSIMDACKLEVHAALKNAFNAFQCDFDQGDLRDSGYIYGPSLPRSLILGTVLRF